MRVFITGIAGFLGSHLADWFLHHGHQVVGCDNLFGGEMINVPHSATYYQHDICELDGLPELMEGCEVVYHCAAAAYEGASVFAPAFISKNIYLGSAAVFSAAIRARARRIVNCSSMARYGSGDPPFREDSTPRPQDPYGIAKLAVEQLLANLGDTHGIEWATAVPHNIYGPRQKYDDPYRNVASIMSNLMLQGREPVIYGKGNQKRCFSYVDDAVDCLAKMAFRQRILGHVINIGPDEETITINDLYSRLAAIIGYSGRPSYMPDRPQEVFHATCSADKARELLGYRTSVFLDDGLHRLVDAIRERGPKPFTYHLTLEFITEMTPTTWREQLL